MLEFFHREHYSLKRWRKDSLLAIVFGSLTAITIIGGSMLVRVASGSRALYLLESIFPTTRFLGSAVMTASATILALMVTLLSLGRQTKRELDGVTLRRIKQIALLGTISFVMAVIFLSLHSIPLSDIDFADSRIIQFLYYATMAYAGALGGVLVAVIFLLYFAVRDMIYAVDPHIEKDKLPRRN